MLFTKTRLEGAWLVEPEPIPDSRGWFARTFCEREFEAHGLEILRRQKLLTPLAGS